jgi:hypothetical protein
MTLTEFKNTLSDAARQRWPSPPCSRLARRPERREAAHRVAQDIEDPAGAVHAYLHVRKVMRATYYRAPARRKAGVACFADDEWASIAEALLVVVKVARSRPHDG